MFTENEIEWKWKIDKEEKTKQENDFCKLANSLHITEVFLRK